MSHHPKYEHEPFVDIHCHLLPALDDGAQTWDETLMMADLAVADGIETIVATPHQAGEFAHNRAEIIRASVSEVQIRLDAERIPLRVLPGADVRIEYDLVDRVTRGDLLSLGDHGQHVLLELPHELYFPLDLLIEALYSAGMVGILSHPERNQGILHQPEAVNSLVDQGCLMQVTAGSLTGLFGRTIQAFSEHLVQKGLVHFVATDAHGPRARRPLLRRAFEHLAELAGWEVASDLCCRNGARVISGEAVPSGRRQIRRRGLVSWFC